MIRLNYKNKNTPEEYNRIYAERSLCPVDEDDYERWKKLLKHYKGGSLLDMGCLDSLCSILAYGMYQDDVWGIDIAEEAIRGMQERFPEVQYKNYDLTSTPFSDGQFDYVILGEVIEHLEYPQKAIAEAFRLLKPGGVLALSTPLEEAREKGAVDGDHHMWSFSKKDIEEMLRHFKKVRTTTMRSRLFPYKYRFPVIIAYATKG